MVSHGGQPDSQEDRHHVVAGILRTGELSLLCHRAPSRRWYPNVWDLPGGHVEPGEEPLDALRRELREELGVEMGKTSADPISHITGADFELDIYLVHTWDGRVRNGCPAEHDEIAWFGPGTVELKALDFAHPALPILLRDLSIGGAG